MMCGSGRHHCTINGKRPGHEVGTYGPNFAHTLLSVSTCAAHVLGRVKVLGRITNQSCTLAVPSRLAEIGALELHEVGRWCSVHRHCLLSTTGRGWYCFQDGKSFMKVRQPLLCSLLTHTFLLVFTPHAHNPFGVFLAVVAGWHTGVALLQHYFGGCLAHLAEWFFAIIILEGCVANQARRGADKHEKRAQGQRPGKKAFPGRDWQTFPDRELAKRPRQGLQNVPRQGTGKRSQAGSWQASQEGTANVPRQGTGKCSQGGNCRRPRAGDSGCSHAGNCKHCKSLATTYHRPLGATPPPTSRVLCDELACLLTGRGAIVKCNFNSLKCS